MQYNYFNGDIYNAQKIHHFHTSGEYSVCLASSRLAVKTKCNHSRLDTTLMTLTSNYKKTGMV